MLRSPLITVMIAAARKAARSLVRDFGEVENLQVSLKGPSDFVSSADQRAEDIVFRELSKARPTFGFLMEERGEVKGSDPSQKWIVDPLDGTTNFLHGIPQFAISIAAMKDDAVLAGLIYNPIADEMFVAERGRGGFLNERRLRVAGRRELSNSVVCCGIPHAGRGNAEVFRKELAAVQTRVAGVRRFGAAALDLAWVAAGRFDGFWERSLSPWDLAAGMLIVREAGGLVTDLDGDMKVLEKGSVLAGNEYIHGALLSAIRSA
ncbi:MAG TPA: inositol monophosphatase family protein [Xanthobacteraceae bacterium]|nr:inositol monophosphatase family protein [Xanthobacteraceae bacterium]